MFNVLTIDSATQAGGIKKAEAIARELIGLATEQDKNNLPGFEFKEMHGQVTVVTNEFSLARIVAAKRRALYSILMTCFRNRQVRGFYVNPIFVS